MEINDPQGGAVESNPAIVVTPTVSALETPASTPAPIIETPALEAAPSAPTTVLGAIETKPEIIPTEVPAEAVEIPVVETDANSQSVETAPLPTYEPFVIPDDIKLEDTKLVEFTKELGEFQNLTKAGQAEVQAFGQKLVDRHLAEVQSATQRLSELYENAWKKQTSDWYESFKADPEIGGNREQTTVNAALEFVRTHGGNDAQQAEFRKLMETTGVGNHPAVIRLMANAMNAYREGKPLPAVKPVAQPTSKVSKRYGGNN